MIYPIGERARGAYSGAQSLLRLRSPEKDSGSGDQSVVETLHEFSYMFPPNMGVIVFCTSPDSMYPGNLAGTMVERGRLSARSADSSLPPNPAEKTRIRTSSGAEGGYLGAVWREVSLSCSRRMRSMGTPALEGIIDKGGAEKTGGRQGTLAEYRVACPGPGDRTVRQGRRRAHLRFGRPAGWRVFEQAPHHGFRTIHDVEAVPSGVVGRTTINSHGFCRGAPEKAQKSPLRLGFLVKDSQIMAPFFRY